LLLLFGVVTARITPDLPLLEFYRNNPTLLTERVEWLNFDSSYTNRFEEQVYQLCRKSTVQDVSAFLELGYDAVEGIFHRRAKKRRRHAGRNRSVS
jgi:hypothetical protein